MAEASRRQARQRAVQVLFEAEQRDEDCLELLGARESGLGEPVPPYTGVLVRGVMERIDQIDELIVRYSQGWTLERMPAVDRQVLRVGVYEIFWQDDVPEAVSVDEAASLAKAMSTDESPRFVNGLLGRLMDLKPTIVVD